MKKIATEAQEQAALFQWAAVNQGKYPDLRWMYHVPNGGRRDKRTAAILQAEGVKPGVPDICLPVPRGGSNGLYVELKRIKGGRLSPKQVEWLDGLSKQGYAVARCDGWEHAARVIVAYLEGV